MLDRRVLTHQLFIRSRLDGADVGCSSNLTSSCTCLAFYVLYFELPALEEVQQCIVLQLVRARWRHPRLSQPVELPGRAGG